MSDDIHMGEGFFGDGLYEGDQERGSFTPHPVSAEVDILRMQLAKVEADRQRQQQRAEAAEAAGTQLRQDLLALPRYLLRQVARGDGQDWMAKMLPESDVILQRDDEDRWIKARDLADRLARLDSLKDEKQT